MLGLIVVAVFVGAATQAQRDEATVIERAILRRAEAPDRRRGSSPRRRASRAETCMRA